MKKYNFSDETNKKINETLELGDKLIESMKSIDKDTKIIDSYTETRYGFPVVLKDVKMVKVRGEWTPEINYNDLTKKVLTDLALKQTRLTGKELKFIRLHFEMTVKVFCNGFGLAKDLVNEYESSDDPVSFAWGIEKGIRYYVLDKIYWWNLESECLFSSIEENVIVLNNDEFDTVM